MGHATNIHKNNDYHNLVSQDPNVFKKSKGICADVYELGKTYGVYNKPFRKIKWIIVKYILLAVILKNYINRVDDNFKKCLLLRKNFIYKT